MKFIFPNHLDTCLLYTSKEGSFHSGDLWYVHGTLDRSWRAFGEADRRLSEDVYKRQVYANAAIFRIYCAAAYTFYGKTLPYNGEPRSQGDVVMTIHEPLGVFANIVPFNYPCELAAHKLAPMLVTGNSVVLMPSSKTPRSAIMIVDRLYRAGVPANAICLSLIHI